MVEYFYESKIYEEEANLVIWDKQTNLLQFYETNNSENFILEDNFRYQIKSWFKDDVKQEMIFNFNVKPAKVSFCSKGLPGVIHTMNEFLMQKETFLKEVLTSQISTEQLGIQFIDNDRFHRILETPQDFYKAAMLSIKSCFSYFYLDYDQFNISDHNKIMARNSQISISNQIGNNTFLGENCVIGEKVVIENSIIC